MASSQQTDGGSQLDWPPEHDRTLSAEREPYPHDFRVSCSEAFDNILTELRTLSLSLGIRSLRFSRSDH